MTASRCVRRTVWVPPAVPAVLQPQPSLAASIPPVHVVELMTGGRRRSVRSGGSTRSAARSLKEAKLVECPAPTNSLPEFSAAPGDFLFVREA